MAKETAVALGSKAEGTTTGGATARHLYQRYREILTIFVRYPHGRLSSVPLLVPLLVPLEKPLPAGSQKVEPISFVSTPLVCFLPVPRLSLNTLCCFWKYA